MQLTQRQHGLLLLVMATALFSAKGIFVKLAYAYPVLPMQLILVRMLMALPVYIAVCILLWPSERHSLNPRNLLLTALFGISGYYIASYFDLYGLVYLPASLERLVLFTYPGLVVLLAAIFLRQPLHKRQSVWLLLIYAGLCLVFGEDLGNRHQQSQQQLLGAAMVFVAALAFAVYMIGNEVMQRELSSRMFTGIAMLSASLMIIGHFSLHYPWQALLHLPLPVYGYAFLIAIVSTVLPSFMLAAGIRQLGAATGGIIGSTGPILTLLMAAIWLGEQLTVLQMTGFAVVILAVYQLGRSRSRD